MNWTLIINETEDGIRCKLGVSQLNQPTTDDFRRLLKYLKHYQGDLMEMILKLEAKPETDLIKEFGGDTLDDILERLNITKNSKRN